MAEQHTTQSPPFSPPEDAANDITGFPTLTETPAAMSPAPPGHGFSAPPESSGAEGSSSVAEEGDDDSAWSTETEEDDIESYGALENLSSTNRRAFPSLQDDDDDDEDDENSRARGLLGLINRSSRFNRPSSEPGMRFYKSALTPRNLESCLKLEEVCFPGVTTDKNKVSLNGASHHPYAHVSRR
jgi:hypothetical protein